MQTKTTTIKSIINNLVAEQRYAEAIDRLNEVMDSHEPVREPKASEELFRPWRAKRQEHFLAATLDGAHQLIKVHVVTKGLVNRTVVHPREVFRPAIEDNAEAIIVCHNHPSGTLEASPEDIDITKRLLEAARIVGIQILDHLIISRRGWLSFSERGIGGF
jgi:DNA repair protein RadC